MRNFLYSVEREYSVPVATLWDAWTDASKLEAWYHPTDLQNVAGLTESDAVEGGVWAVAVDVPEYGFVAYFFGKYSDLRYCQSLEHTMHYTQSLEEFEARDFESESHCILVGFEDRGDKAWVMPAAKAWRLTKVQNICRVIGPPRAVTNNAGLCCPPKISLRASAR